MSDESHDKRIERRLRLAGLFVALGLAIEWFTLRSTTPATFLTFVAAVGTCLPIGALLFLSTLLRTGPKDS